MTTTISDEQVLLPCPFCGVAAVRVSGWGGYTKCGNLQCFLGGPDDEAMWISESEWNARAPDPRVVELVAADKEYDAMVARRNMYPCPGMDEHVVAARKRRAKAIAAMENDNG